MGKSTISMAIFNSYVKLPEGISVLQMLAHCNLKDSKPLESSGLNTLVSSVKLPQERCRLQASIWKRDRPAAFASRPLGKWRHNATTGENDDAGMIQSMVLVYLIWLRIITDIQYIDGLLLGVL
jgi:hypothetical protein